MSEKLKIRILTFSEIIEFSENIAHKVTSGLIPIDRTRAKCLSTNPDIDKKLPALILVLDDNDSCVGYMGLLPALMKLGARSYDMLWPSTGKISLKKYPKHPSSLVVETLKTMENVIVSTGNTLAAEKFYIRNNFKEYKIDDAREILRWRYDVFYFFYKAMYKLEIKFLEKYLKGLFLKISDFFRSVLIYLIDLTLNIFPEVKIKTSLSDEAAEFLSQTRISSFPRSAKNLQWIVHNPWFPSLFEQTENEQQYFFSSVHNSVKYYVLEFGSHASTSYGVAIISQIESSQVISFKLLEMQSKSSFVRTALMLKCFKLFLKEKGESLLFHRSMKPSILIKVLFAFMSRKVFRKYYVWFPNDSSDEAFQEAHFSLMDGDCCHW